MNIALELALENAELWTLGKVIQRVAAESASASHTIGLLKGFLADFPELTPKIVMDNVEKAGFFKPEGIERVAKAIGMPKEELAALQVRIGTAGAAKMWK